MAHFISNAISYIKLSIKGMLVYVAYEKCLTINYYYLTKTWWFIDVHYRIELAKIVGHNQEVPFPQTVLPHTETPAMSIEKLKQIIQNS